jgi:hypothetical protein
VQERATSVSTHKTDDVKDTSRDATCRQFPVEKSTTVTSNTVSKQKEARHQTTVENPLRSIVCHDRVQLSVSLKGSDRESAGLFKGALVIV